MLELQYLVIVTSMPSTVTASYVIYPDGGGI